MFLRPPLLPEDLRYMGTNSGEIQPVTPALERWLRHVFTVMGGFIMGTGILIIFVAVSTSATWQRGTGYVLALVGLFTVGTMSVTNFQIDSDFKWLLLIPALLWLVGVVAYSISSRSNR